jgi:hypothetical protein
MALIPRFAGRLGNILFELASCYGLAKDNNRKLRIWWHTLNREYNTFLKKWIIYHRIIMPTEIVKETDLHPITLTDSETIMIDGYLQNWKYFWKYREEVIELLSFDTSIANKYPLLSESAFIHVRGGDYRILPLHFVELSNYYPSAISHVKADHYYIFTDDTEYLSKQGWLSTINYTIVNENPVDSLYLMSQCQRGAICANSSFSWWGAFLNINRPICMPSKWFNDDKMYTAGYYFTGVTVLEV